MSGMSGRDSRSLGVSVRSSTSILSSVCVCSPSLSFFTEASSGPTLNVYPSSSPPPRSRPSLSLLRRSHASRHRTLAFLVTTLRYISAAWPFCPRLCTNNGLPFSPQRILSLSPPSCTSCSDLGGRGNCGRAGRILRTGPSGDENRAGGGGGVGMRLKRGVALFELGQAAVRRAGGSGVEARPPLGRRRG